MSDWEDDDPVPASKPASRPAPASRPLPKAPVDDWSDDEGGTSKWNGGASARGGPSRGRGGGGGTRGWQDDQVKFYSFKNC